MKFKKALAGILSAAMIVTLTPAMAFATSTNTVNAVPTVAEDESMPKVELNIEVKDANWGTDEQTIKLTFNNAKWSKKPETGTSSLNLDKTVVQPSPVGTTATVVSKAAVYSVSISTALGSGAKLTITNVTTTGGSIVYDYDVSATTASDQAAAVAAAITAMGADSLYDASADDAKLTLTAKNGGAIADDPAADVTGGTGAVGDVSTDTAGADAVFADDGTPTGMHISNATITDVVAASNNSIEFTFKPTAATKGTTFTITFDAGVLKSKSDSGAVEIAVDGLDSNVSSGTVTAGTVTSGKTTASVTGDIKTYGRVSSQTLESAIEIRETAVNAITGNQVIKLTLPKGVSWKSLTLSGNLVSGSPVTTSNKVASAGAVTASGDYYLTDDERSVYVFVPVTGDAAVRQVLNITGSIEIGKTASLGDITVDVTSYKATGNAISDASDLVIAKYGEESVVISTASEIPTIYAGFEKTNKDKYNWIQLTIKETVKDSLQSGRYIDVELPEEVQVVSGASVIKSVLKGDAKLSDASTYTNLDSSYISFEDTKDRSEFTLTVPDDNANTGLGGTWSDSKANTWTLFIPVTVKADFEGDIEVSLKGAKAGIDDTTIVVATAESPVTVATASTDVKNGVQKQTVADITITEKVVGYMKAGTTLTVSLDDLGLDNSLVFDKATVKVTAGDLEIGKTTVSKGVINIPIKEESTKVSTISITGISATLNRTLPEGPYDLLVGEVVDGGSSALIDNEAYDNKKFEVAPVTVEGYINIVTPADSATVDTKIDSQFVIGQSSYTNNGEAAEMDAAPYIDSNNRTMVPIRYIANACGVSDDNITWDQATQTATLNGTNTVVTIKVGSNTIQTSTGTITMDTVAVNNNGRIYVPARFIANALGADVTWDAATKTVGISK
jgi:hypothetical protein